MQGVASATARVTTTASFHSPSMVAFPLREALDKGRPPPPPGPPPPSSPPPPLPPLRAAKREAAAPAGAPLQPPPAALLLLLLLTSNLLEEHLDPSRKASRNCCAEQQRKGVIRGQAGERTCAVRRGGISYVRVSQQNASHVRLERGPRAYLRTYELVLTATPSYETLGFRVDE